MQILFDKKTQKKASTYSLTPNELAFADLVACGWDLKDAYMLATGQGLTWTEAAVLRSARELAARVGTKNRIKELRNGKLAQEVVDQKKEEEDITKALSKEAMLRDLYLARKKMTVGSKDWLDTNKMIADITRMKQEEIKTEDNTVLYYLPLTCNKCSLYIERKKQNNL